MEVLLKFTVDRKRWLRGEGEPRSRLLRSSDGKMCCLGFACLAAGHTEDEIRDVATPSGLAYRRDGRCLLPNYNTPQMCSAMEWNDYPGQCELSEARREAIIAERLAEIGLEVTFEG